MSIDRAEIVTLSEFLAQLDQLGVKLWTENGELRFKAPKGALTEALRAELSVRKAEILQLLQSSSVKPAFEVPPTRFGRLRRHRAVDAYIG